MYRVILKILQEIRVACGPSSHVRSYKGLATRRSSASIPPRWSVYFYYLLTQLIKQNSGTWGTFILMKDCFIK